VKKLIAIALLCCAALVHALPDAVRKGEAGWRQWGSGEMTWFGFSLYRATLWVAGNAVETSPSALQLDYLRDIPRDRLVQVSLDEMSRLGADAPQLQRWEPELRRVFPDVKEGDTIIGVHYPGRGAQFYYQGKPSGEVADPEFARRFFGIWLDTASRSPALRTALLKRPDGG
jgi:hypothetical protein